MITTIDKKIYILLLLSNFLVIFSLIGLYLTASEKGFSNSSSSLTDDRYSKDSEYFPPSIENLATESNSRIHDISSPNDLSITQNSAREIYPLKNKPSAKLAFLFDYNKNLKNNQILKNTFHKKPSPTLIKFNQSEVFFSEIVINDDKQSFKNKLLKSTMKNNFFQEKSRKNSSVKRVKFLNENINTI